VILLGATGCETVTGSFCRIYDPIEGYDGIDERVAVQIDRNEAPFACMCEGRKEFCN
jgi:hypothetical protein